LRVRSLSARTLAAESWIVGVKSLRLLSTFR
jgi:hypothetical protein